MSQLVTKVSSSLIVPTLENNRRFIYVLTEKDGKWGLPAGKLNPFEHPERAGIRETYEEIQAQVVINSLIGIWNFKSEHQSSIINFVYEATIVDRLPRAIRKEGILDLQDFNIGDLRKLYEAGELRAGKANLEPIEEYLAGTRFPRTLVHSLA